MKKAHHARKLLAALLLASFALFGYGLYSYFVLEPIMHTLYLDVIEGQSIDVLEDFEQSKAKSVYVYFAHTNPVPFYFLGRGENRTREVIVSGIYDFPVEVDASVEGEIAPMVYLSERSFTVMPGEEHVLRVDVIVPLDAVKGNYTGKLVLNRRRV